MALIDADIALRARHAGVDANGLEAAARILLSCFQCDGKVLIFGNGGSAADAQHMAAELVGQVRRTRAPLAAIALTTDASVVTAIANDYGFDQVFARQVTALGRPGDVAIAISVSGTSANVLAGIDAARRARMRVIGITGSLTAPLARLGDAAITVEADDTQAIQEAHLVAEHALCDAVEHALFGESRGVVDGRARHSRVLALPELLELRVQWRASGLTVVWTNGVFDLLHLGHVRSLEAAKRFGDLLVVGVNADVTVRAAKGPERPVVPEAERAQLVAALGAVDYVTIFREPDPSEVLRQLQPHVHCKGDEYASRPMPERAIVEAYGGRVELIPRLPDLSTTRLLQRGAFKAATLSA